ncbi:MAG: archease [Bacteroidota bacterium]
MDSDTTKMLPHTADVALLITSETLPGLFRLGLQSLNNLLKPDYAPKMNEAKVTEVIELKSPDRTTLLIDFLSEVLTLSQIHKAIFSDFDINRMTDCELSATLSGKKVDLFDEDVKAVTYHEANMSLNEDGDWQTKIIFDI